MDREQPVASDNSARLNLPALPLFVGDSAASCQVPYNIDARHSAFTIVHGHQINNDSMTAIGEHRRISEGCAMLIAATASDERRRMINQWLSAPDPSVNHNAACKKRQPTTGTWFVDGDVFNNWKMGQCSFVWLHGIREFASESNLGCRSH